MYPLTFVLGNQNQINMSKNSTHQIPCPSCGHTGEFTRWDSINVDLDPDMREKAKCGAIFTWTCPHCGETFTVPYATLYHDMKRNLMIYYLPTRPEDGKGLSISSFKHHFSLNPEYTYRCTYEIEDFMEKIAQLESGLDDRVIELLKMVMTGKNHPKDLPENAELRFVAAVPDNGGEPKTLMFRCVTGKENNSKDQKVMMVPFEVYKDLDKEPMARKMFEQEAEFPEVSQAFLRRLLGK